LLCKCSNTGRKGDKVDGLKENTTVATLKLDISVNARNQEEAEIINCARLHDLKQSLLYSLADAVNVLSENTERTGNKKEL
jgi:hypothetical protein